MLCVVECVVMVVYCIEGVVFNFLNFVGKIFYMVFLWVYKKNDVFDVVMNN